jgi:hypothetical protein
MIEPEQLDIVIPERRARYPRNPRGFLVHGWAFRDLSPGDVDAIRTFMSTGRIGDLPDGYQMTAVRRATEWAS